MNKKIKSLKDKLFKDLKETKHKLKYLLDPTDGGDPYEYFEGFRDAIKIILKTINQIGSGKLKLKEPLNMEDDFADIDLINLKYRLNERLKNLKKRLKVLELENEDLLYEYTEGYKDYFILILKEINELDNIHFLITNNAD